MAKKITPFFSIIIPALNEEKYLPNLLSDLSMQSFQDFEVIVVDGNSDDKTVEKASSYLPSLPALSILTSPRRHVSIQRNYGTTVARGDYLVFMDADNRVPSYFLDGLHYRVLEQQPDTFTTWCSPDEKNPGSIAISNAINLIIEASKIVEYEGALGALIGCKRSIFDHIGGFDDSMGFGEDGEFIRRATSKNFSFLIFKDPKFTFSLRRLRREGTLYTVQQSAKLFIKNMRGEKINQLKEYPMGGSAKPIAKSKIFLNKLNKSFNKLTSRSKFIKEFRLTLENILRS